MLARIRIQPRTTFTCPKVVHKCSKRTTPRQRNLLPEGHRPLGRQTPRRAGTSLAFAKITPYHRRRLRVLHALREGLAPFGSALGLRLTLTPLAGLTARFIPYSGKGANQGSPSSRPIGCAQPSHPGIARLKPEPGVSGRAEHSFHPTLLRILFESSEASPLCGRSVNARTSSLRSQCRG